MLQKKPSVYIVFPYSLSIHHHLSGTQDCGGAGAYLSYHKAKAGDTLGKLITRLTHRDTHIHVY